MLVYKTNVRSISMIWRRHFHHCITSLSRLRSGMLNVRNVLNHKVKLGLGTGAERDNSLQSFARPPQDP